MGDGSSTTMASLLAKAMVNNPAFIEIDFLDQTDILGIEDGGTGAIIQQYFFSSQLSQPCILQPLVY